MKGQKQKIGLMIALLFITIGFAALTTVLVINGSVTIGTSKETFDSDVIFTKAKTNTEGMAVIAQDGKSITFATNEITELGQESTLDFSITNKSRIYDADAVIECTMVDETNTYNDYISLTVDPEEFQIPASETKEGNLKVKLIKSYIGEGETIKFSCTISANAIERDGEAGEIVIDPSETNVISGYLFDENNIPVANTNIVIMADKPYYATTDSNGYYEIAGVQNGSYPVYIISSDKTLDEVKEMNNQEIKDNAVGKGQLTTDNMNVSFDNNYKQESSETVNKYTIIFNANGGNAGALTKEVIENAMIGEFPIFARTGYTFDGWYTEASGGNKVTNTTRVTQNQTLYAQWMERDYYVDIKFTGIYTSIYESYPANFIYYGGTNTSLYKIMTSVGLCHSGVGCKTSISCTNGYSATSEVTDDGYVMIEVTNNNIDDGSVCTVNVYQ